MTKSEFTECQDKGHSRVLLPKQISHHHWHEKPQNKDVVPDEVRPTPTANQADHSEDEENVGQDLNHRAH